MNFEKCDGVVAGGGPAGMLLGCLLARAGVDVVVLDKLADFLRDFRLLMVTDATALAREREGQRVTSPLSRSPAGERQQSP
jgi:2-polyprenyl-6-methoxyphenol hydroxylase-like FAD-dependent oxidoreductase